MCGAGGTNGWWWRSGGVEVDRRLLSLKIKGLG